MFPGRAKQLVMDFIRRHKLEYTSPPTEMADLGEQYYTLRLGLMDTCADCAGSRLQRYYFKTTTSAKKVKVLITLVSSCSVHCMYC